MIRNPLSFLHFGFLYILNLGIHWLSYDIDLAWGQQTVLTQP